LTESSRNLRAASAASSTRLTNMRRLFSFALFIVVLFGATGLVHGYVWLRLVKDPMLTPALERACGALLIGLWVSIPASLLVARSGKRWTLPLVWVSSIWLGVLSILVVVLALADVASRLLRAASSALLAAQPQMESARQLALLVVVVTAGLAVLALRSGLGRVSLREVGVPLARLPPELHGTTIVQLSDLHVGPIIGRTFIERIVAQANAARPDLIVITGDLVDGSVERLREHVAPLARLTARWGVYFVTGNHEYYSGADAWCAEIERLGIRVLRNERVVIGDAGQSFDLAGIDDLYAQRSQAGALSHVARALAGRDPKRELVLLAHQPSAVFEASQHGVGLQLSGHTHGGQIWPWNYLVRLQQPLVSGLARFGQTHLYVSNGTGYWGPPMRLAAPAEVTRLRLWAVPPL
jgi:predicted MPP superfamily phosphohydrolase